MSCERSIVIEWRDNENVMIEMGEARVGVCIMVDMAYEHWMEWFDCDIEFKAERVGDEKDNVIVYSKCVGDHPDIVENVEIAKTEVLDDGATVSVWYRVVLTNGFVFRGEARPIVEEKEKGGE